MLSGPRRWAHSQQGSRVDADSFSLADLAEERERRGENTCYSLRKVHSLYLCLCSRMSVKSVAQKAAPTRELELETGAAQLAIKKAQARTAIHLVIVHI